MLDGLSQIRLSRGLVNCDDCRVWFSKDGDEGEWGKGEPGVDSPEQRSKEIEKLDLEKAEGLQMQNLAVQPPCQNAHSIKAQNSFKLKAGAGTDVGNLLGRVAAEVAQYFI